MKFPEFTKIVVSTGILGSTTISAEDVDGIFLGDITENARTVTSYVTIKGVEQDRNTSIRVRKTANNLSLTLHQSATKDYLSIFSGNNITRINLHSDDGSILSYGVKWGDKSTEIRNSRQKTCMLENLIWLSINDENEMI